MIIASLSPFITDPSTRKSSFDIGWWVSWKIIFPHTAPLRLSLSQQIILFIALTICNDCVFTYCSFSFTAMSVLLTSDTWQTLKKYWWDTRSETVELSKPFSPSVLLRLLLYYLSLSIEQEIFSPSKNFISCFHFYVSQSLLNVQKQRFILLALLKLLPEETYNSSPSALISFSQDLQMAFQYQLRKSHCCHKETLQLQWQLNTVDV